MVRFLRMLVLCIVLASIGGAHAEMLPYDSLKEKPNAILRGENIESNAVTTDGNGSTNLPVDEARDPRAVIEKRFETNKADMQQCVSQFGSAVCEARQQKVEIKLTSGQSDQADQPELLDAGALQRCISRFGEAACEARRQKLDARRERVQGSRSDRWQRCISRFGEAACEARRQKLDARRERMQGSRSDRSSDLSTVQRCISRFGEAACEARKQMLEAQRSRMDQFKWDILDRQEALKAKQEQHRKQLPMAHCTSRFGIEACNSNRFSQTQFEGSVTG